MRQKQGITSRQFRQALADIKDATGAAVGVAEISEGTGLSKAYISEFRNDTRNLTGAQQSQLAAFIEKKCDDAGIEFPEAEDTSADDEEIQLKRLLAAALSQVSKPSIPLSENIPADKRDAIQAMIRKNDVRIAQLMGEQITKSGFLFSAGYSEQSDSHIRELFGLLAINYVGTSILTGNNILHEIEKSDPEFDPNTVGQLLSKFMSDTDFSEFVPDVQHDAADISEGSGDD